VLCSDPAVAVLKSASIDGSNRSKLFEVAITVFGNSNCRVSGTPKNMPFFLL